MPTEELSVKKERFCQEYLIDLNATAAAKRAGYSVKTAKQIGYLLLTDPCLRERVAELMKIRSETTQITQGMVLHELWSIANDDIKNFLSFKTEKEIVTDPETGMNIEKDRGMIVTIKDSDEVNTRNVSQVSCGKDGQFRFRLYNRENALIHVGRHLGMFTEKKNELDEEGTRKSTVPIINILPRQNYMANEPD